METHARHITIGIFVLFLVAVGFGVALWLGGVRSDREFRYYRVMFDEPVIGLSIGSPVQYSGITVGEIVALSLLPEDPRRAIARVRVDTSIAIRQDTRAELVVTGITGAAVIQLSDGGPNVPLLSRKDGEEPLILAPRSALASLVSGDGNTMTTVNGILRRTHDVFSPENVALIHRTLVNLESTSSAIAEQRSELAALVNNLTEASQESTAALRKANAVIGDAQSILNEEGRPALASTREAMASLERSSARIESVLQRNEASLDQGLASAGPAMNELRLSLSNLNTVLRRLDRNPAGYLLGGENIEETKP